MESTRVTVCKNGHLALPPQMMDALGLQCETEVEVVLHERFLEFKQPRKLMTEAEARQGLLELQALFAGGPSLEDELYKMRREEEEHQRQKFGW